MNIYLACSLTTLWWICYPVCLVLYYLAVATFFILKLLYQPVAFLLLPLVSLARFVIAIAAIPVHILAKLEPLYNYLGIAALVGILGGLATGYVYGSLHQALSLDSQTPPRRKARTAKQYRDAKRTEKAKAEAPLMSPGYVSLSDGTGKGRHRNKGLLGQTIMEEMDSDY